MEERLQACSEYMIQPEVKYANISSFNKVWDEEDGNNGNALVPDKKYFDDDKELYLEIGCGKGNFIIKKAIANPDKNFLAIEGQETVILRALEKVKELADKADAGQEGGVHLSNLKFMMNFVHSMDDLFEEDQLSGIYLNFSIQQFRAANLCACGCIQYRLRRVGQIHPQILNAVFIPAAVCDLSCMDGQRFVQILGIAADTALTTLGHSNTSR